MADISEQTPRGFPVPHPLNELQADVHRLRAALNAVDSAMDALQSGIDAKASTADVNAAVNALNAAIAGHAAAATAHTKAQVGLGNVDNTADANKPVSAATAAALADKQPKLVSGSNIKTVGGQSILGGGNVDVQQWTQATSQAAQDGTDLAAATRYSVISGTNRYLPNAPAIGFRVALLDAASLFVGGTWQLKRRNAAHKINNIAQDVTFNFPQGIVTVEYAAANTWVLA